MEAIAPLLGRTLVMVAHPDDETIGCGALLQRMREPVVVFCTDGAPRDHYFWAKHGSRERYAEARMREAAAALEVLGVREFVFLSEEGSHLFIDQDLFLAIPQALQRVHELIDRYQPEALLTHAYEGGHPDHDTCCFMGSALAQERQLPAWEFPLYYRERVDLVRQQEFVEPGGSEVLLDVTMEELEQKRQMMAAHVSQTHAIAEFNLAIERFRPMAAYDFSAPPHPGVLNYEVWQWPMTGAQLVSAFQCYRDKRAHPEPGTRGPGVREVA
jgi:LmbE family N-acetylglucosaminyl deacetylase